MTNIVLAALSTGIEGGFSVIYDIPQDLWDRVSQVFDKSNVNKLLWSISGDSTATVDNMAPIEALAASRMTSADMIANYNKVNPASADDDYSVSAKSYDAEIIVELGGLKWTPVYLSTTNEGLDGEPHDVILTLWLADSTQLSGETFADGRTFDENGFCTFNSGFAVDYSTSLISAEVPDNLYGASYMRAAVLNNGGKYSNKSNSTIEELVDFKQNNNSVFAKFTMQDFGLTQYLVTPEHVLWQKEGQSTAPIYGMSYNCQNENWSNEVPDDGFYSPEYNYAHRKYNDVWKDDYLWLPSLSETGSRDNFNGIWETSQNQRKNDGEDSWLRTGRFDTPHRVYSVRSDGIDWLYGNVTAHWSLRPALHLNLTAVANSLHK